MTVVDRVEPAPVVLGLDGLTVDDVHRVAVERAPLELTRDVVARLEAGRGVVDQALAAGKLIYGLNTHLGHGRDTPVSLEELAMWQVRMVVVHAGGVGEPLPDEAVRAMMVARVAGFARGGSGVHPDLCRTLLEMLNAGVHPIVPEVGSVGAGDLMHLAAIGMVAIGQGSARYGEEVLTGAEAMARAGLTPAVLRAKDGLAVISANATSIGLGALVMRRAAEVADLADEVAALTFEALSANLSPFDEEAARAKPFRGQITTAARVRRLLRGSYLSDPETIVSVQDALSLRTVPQVHGALRDQLAYTQQAVEVELNAQADNPLVSVETGRIFSTGNFSPMTMAIALEGLRVALAHVGLLAERRAHKVANLLFERLVLGADGDEPATLMVPGLLTYSAAAVLAELRHLANPVTLNCPPLDADFEDHASLAPLAVTTTTQCLDRLETILLIEAMTAAQTIVLLQPAPRLGEGTAALYDYLLQTLGRPEGNASGADAVAAVRAALRGRPRPSIEEVANP